MGQYTIEISGSTKIIEKNIYIGIYMFFEHTNIVFESHLRTLLYETSVELKTISVKVIFKKYFKKIMSTSKENSRSGIGHCIGNNLQKCILFILFILF